MEPLKGRFRCFLFYGVIGMEQGELRICRKCLLREAQTGEEYFRSLRQYIDNLDPDVRASQDVYESRLLVCRDCELLFQAMCRSCGCYVELRAALAAQECPRKKW